MRYLKLLFFTALLSLFLNASDAEAEVRTKIIDTGAGLATVTRFPDGSIMVYDTGHWNHDPRVFTEFHFIGNADIDLLIASHSDADHVAATDELFNGYRVHRVIRTGLERSTATWRAHSDAIVAAANSGHTHDINFANATLPHGTTFQFGGGRPSPIFLAFMNRRLPGD